MHKHGPNSSPRDIASVSRAYVDEPGIRSARGPEFECWGALVLALFAIAVFRFGLFSSEHRETREPIMSDGT